MKKKLLVILVALILFVAPAIFAENNYRKEDLLPTVVAIVGAQSLGSGVIVTDDGYIVTARHVVMSDSYYKAYLWNWNEYRVRVVARHPSMDIAVIKIESLEPTLKFITPGFPEKMELGDEIYALGHPYGQPWTLSKGIISAFRKTTTFIRYIQTDAPINPGNSGGPLLDEFGRIIGIFSLGMRGADGINYAIDMRSFYQFVEDVIIYDMDKYKPIEWEEAEGK